MAGHGKPGKIRLSNFSLSEDMSTESNLCPDDAQFHVTGGQRVPLQDFASYSRGK
jgi:hypothetical protein